MGILEDLIPILRDDTDLNSIKLTIVSLGVIPVICQIRIFISTRLSRDQRRALQGEKRTYLLPHNSIANRKNKIKVFIKMYQSKT